MRSKMDALEAQVLSEVRQAWTPPETALAQLRTNLDARLHAPDSPPSAEPPLPAPPLPDSSPSLGSAGGLKALLVTAVTSASVAFAAGYWLGQTSSTDAGEVRSFAPPPAADRAAAPPVPRLEPAPATPEIPAPVAPTPASPGRATSAAPRPRELAPSADASEVKYKDPLDAEVDLLKRVEQALRRNNGRLAVALLRELDETVPHGQLLQERAASRIMADCMNAPGEAREQALGYLARHATSPFAARVRSICQLDPSTHDGSAKTGD